MLLLLSLSRKYTNNNFKMLKLLLKNYIYIKKKKTLNIDII